MPQQAQTRQIPPRRFQVRGAACRAPCWCGVASLPLCCHHVWHDRTHSHNPCWVLAVFHHQLFHAMLPSVLLPYCHTHTHRSRIRPQRCRSQPLCGFLAAWFRYRGRLHHVPLSVSLERSQWLLRASQHPQWRCRYLLTRLLLLLSYCLHLLASQSFLLLLPS